MNVELGGKATGPLRGVRVLDISSIVSGPLCGQILGDLGADVIKLEPPAGDTARYLGQEGPPGMSGLFVQLNRNKRSVTLDLKQEQGKAAFFELVASVDVVVENYRAGVADRLGIGFEASRAKNPGLIWVAISGFGPEGPYSEQPAYDMVIQGMSGFAMTLGDKQNPKLISNLVADKTSGMNACFAVLAALYAREKNAGEGQRIDIPMIDAFGSFVHCDGFAAQTYGGPAAAGLDAIYRAWKTADGHISMLVIENHHFEALCQVIEREDLLADERYETILGRLGNSAELFGIFETEVRKFTTAELVRRAHAHKLPLGPVYDVDAFLRDPQVVYNQTVFEVEDDEAGSMKLFTTAPRFGVTPTNVRRRPPRLGADTEEVLREAGLDDAQIERLRG
jgi:crotonobetainyl-CoA:carnitine CoA-transferase CaiB-like acyl-CoA transferase